MWVWMPLCFVPSYILFLLYFWGICILSALQRPALVSGQIWAVCWQLLWYRAACAFLGAWFFILPEPQVRLQLLRWSTEALMVLWMGSCIAPMMCFPLSVHQDIFYSVLDACFLAPDNPLWLMWTCAEVNWSGVRVFACLLGCCRDKRLQERSRGWSSTGWGE